ncbi:helix-turn-helix domain-containing protein [Cellulomonas sp. JH27-2]|uniref:helix-turn-helix domain-containing protein n=1 Tax=Cellulomonas sp. JH27-2 TaxID=2774139 RepID=UPI001781160D|nr:helix-turn-helix domain-containing protein [Cellulomonas sp. JH27-2]MBD8058330.1 helix-turn-helix domain-containing protein [Cellulomonas sp. JH27-2]
MPPRFLTLADVGEILNISAQQTYQLLHSGDLRGIQIGPKKVWRIEATELESYIQRMYEQARPRTVSETSEA